MAAHVQDEFPAAEVVAVGRRQLGKKAPLKSMRDRRYFPVDEDGLDRAAPVMRLADGTFDTVILPFAVHRLCAGSESEFHALVLEALRVAGEFVLLAEDTGDAPFSDEAAFRRWKVKLQSQHSVPVLLEGDLRGGPIPDHFLSEGEHGRDCTARRFLVLRAFRTSKAASFPPLESGEAVEVSVGPTGCRWKSGVVVDISKDGAHVRVRRTNEASAHVQEEDLALSSGSIRRPWREPLDSEDAEKQAASLPSVYGLGPPPRAKILAVPMLAQVIAKDAAEDIIKQTLANCKDP
eukprot:gnl/TRDRNA2_/TRDRNA2_171306_c2_seq5.p1 gnl/TRDRNA2_/TRDRNA2_171306_c2~~gnl/TRDRNA2_/TRDRNA2_171306_c2_seq5.p1  ORF type:complete len:292 (+),score=60.63 gnl/TRDRNA2_/TRDRNA2_171306_c2_seq5:968-1843(+)